MRELGFVDCTVVDYHDTRAMPGNPGKGATATE
jgi:hypothetical protein